MPRLPGIFTDEEYRIVQDTFTLDTASKYHVRRVIPHTPRRLEIIRALKRDPWDGKTAQQVGRPKGRDADAEGVKLPTLPPANGSVKVATPDTVINACADDDLCVAARTASMRYVANTLEDQKRVIPCTGCKRGIERAKAVAGKKTAHVGALTCSCGDPKTRDARTCHACASERRSLRPQPCRGMKGAAQ